MADTPISQLPVASSIAQSDNLVIDNGIATRITAVINLSSLFATSANFNALSSNKWNNAYTTLQTNSGSWIYVEQPATTLVKSNSGLWDSTYSITYSNSAYWQNVSTVVSTNSAYWQNVSTVVSTNSGDWESAYTVVSNTSALVQTITAIPIKSISSNYNILESDSGKILTTTSTSPITAYITSAINVNGFSTTVAQLSSGSITVMIDPSYSGGDLISYGNLFVTAGKGATANILRVQNNAYLLTGILQ